MSISAGWTSEEEYILDTTPSYKGPERSEIVRRCTSFEHWRFLSLRAISQQFFFRRVYFLSHVPTLKNVSAFVYLRIESPSPSCLFSRFLQQNFSDSAEERSSAGFFTHFKLIYFLKNRRETYLECVFAVKTAQWASINSCNDTPFLFSAYIISKPLVPELKQIICFMIYEWIFDVAWSIRYREPMLKHIYGRVHLSKFNTSPTCSSNSVCYDLEIGA